MQEWRSIPRLLNEQIQMCVTSQIVVVSFVNFSLSL